MFGTLAAFLISQPFLWSWDSLFGPSIPALVTQSMAIVSVPLLMLWILAFSQWSWTGKLLGLLPFVLLIGGLFTSIRGFDPSGDVWLDPIWVWEPTQAQRIAEHKAQTGESGTAASVVTVEPITPRTACLSRSQSRRDRRSVRTAFDWPTRRRPLAASGRRRVRSMAVVGKRLVTIEQRDDDEVVVCYEASTGTSCGLHSYKAKFVEAMGGPAHVDADD